MKKMMFGIAAAMMVFGTTAMNAKNDNKGKNDNHGNNHGIVVNNNAGNHGNHGNTYNWGNHGYAMNHEMMMVRDICHKKDIRNMNFRWTSKEIKAHGFTKRHYFVREIVKGHSTGHMVCKVCGYHMH